MALDPEVMCLSGGRSETLERVETLLLLLHVCGLGWSSDSSRDKLEAARVRRCLSLENHITSLRLALGQGRESAERLVFQEAA